MKEIIGNIINWVILQYPKTARGTILILLVISFLEGWMIKNLNNENSSWESKNELWRQLDREDRNKCDSIQIVLENELFDIQNKMDDSIQMQNEAYLLKINSNQK